MISFLIKHYSILKNIMIMKMKLFIGCYKMDTYYFDLLIKNYTNDKTFITNLKKIDTNLPKLYVGV